MSSFGLWIYMGNISRQIIGSFEDIGKDVLKETTRVPKDILGKAIESFGTSSNTKQKNPQQTIEKPPEEKSGALQELDTTKDVNAKKAVARAALAQIAGNRKPKEPGVWERIQKEKQEQETINKQQRAVAEAGKLKPMSQVRRRGDLYGIQAKKAGSEIGKNVRQD